MKLGVSKHKSRYAYQSPRAQHCLAWEFQIIFGSSSCTSGTGHPNLLTPSIQTCIWGFEWFEFESQQNIKFCLTQTTTRRASLLLCISQGIYRPAVLQYAFMQQWIYITRIVLHMHCVCSALSRSWVPPLLTDDKLITNVRLGTVLPARR